jgi:hypothetical protein
VISKLIACASIPSDASFAIPSSIVKLVEFYLRTPDYCDDDDDDDDDNDADNDDGESDEKKKELVKEQEVEIVDVVLRVLAGKW